MIARGNREREISIYCYIRIKDALVEVANFYLLKCCGYICEEKNSIFVISL